MSGPVRPPLKTQLDNDTSENRPVNTIAFANTDFTLTNSGTKTTVALSGGGGGTIGGSIADTQVAFGSAADTITGTDNFVFDGDRTLKFQGATPRLYLGDTDVSTAENEMLLIMKSGASSYIYDRQDTADLNLGAGDTANHIIIKADGEVIINEGGNAEADFRVESDAYSNMFFIDAGLNKAHFGTGGIDNALGLVQINVGNSTQNALTLSSTDADAAQAPTIEFYRNSSSPASDDKLGQLNFTGKDLNNDKVVYAQMYAQIDNPAIGSHDGRLVIDVVSNAASPINVFRADKDEVIINDVSFALDTRIESNGNENMFFVDGSSDTIGIAGIAQSDSTVTIYDTNDQDVLLRLETDENSADKSPTLEFYKNSAADINDYIMAIDSFGLDDTPNKSQYSRIATYIEDETAATENGVIIFQVAEAGSLRSNFVVGSTLVTVNGGSRNVDFRVLADDGVANIYSDAGTGTVAIRGAANSDSTLSIYDTGTAGDANLELISTQDDLNAAPILQFFRDDIPSASDQTLGEIEFYGRDLGGNRLRMAQISSFVNDATAGGVESTLKFQTLRSSSARELAQWDSYLTDFNPQGADIDFRIRSNNRASMFELNGGTDTIGIYSAPTTGLADNNPVLQVNGSVSSKCAIVTKTSATVDLSTRDSNELIGQLYVLTSTSAKTLTVPTTCTQGDWFRVLTTGANGMDIVASSGATLNGAVPATLTRDAQNEIYTVVAVATDKWICTSG